MKLRNSFFLFIICILLTTSCITNNKKDKGFKETPDVIKGDLDDTERKIKEKYINIEKKLKIGLFLPLSDTPLKVIGNSLLNTAQLYIFEKDPEDIVLMVYDTKGTTFGASSAMDKAIEEGIDVIVGPLLSGETKAILKKAQENDIILFSLSNDQNLVNNDNLFITGYIPEQEINLLLNYAVNSNIKNFVTFLPSNNNGALINQVITKILKAKDLNLIKSDYYVNNDKNFNKKLYNLINSYKIPDRIYEDFNQKKLDLEVAGGDPESLKFEVNEEDKIKPDALFIIEGGRELNKISRLLYQYQNQDTPLILITMNKINEESIKNPFLDATVFIGENSNNFTELSKRYSSLYIENKEIIRIGALIYDLLDVLPEIYSNNKIKNTLNYKKLLNPNGFVGMDGQFRFLPNGLVERRLSIIQIQEKEKVILESNQEFLNY